MWARLADSAPQWRSLLGTWRATGFVEDGVRHYFPSETLAHPSMHQLPDQKQSATPPAGCRCFAVEGGLGAGHQRDIPRVLKRTVSGAEEDACLHAPMHQAVQKYLRFVVNKQVYQSGLPVHRYAVQHSTGHSGALLKMRLKVQSWQRHIGARIIPCHCI